MKVKARIIEKVKADGANVIESFRAYPDAVLVVGGTVRYKFDGKPDPWNAVTISLEGDNTVVLRFYPGRVDLAS